MAALTGVLMPSTTRADPLPLKVSNDWGYYNNMAWMALRRGDLNLAEQRLRQAIKTIRPYESMAQAIVARSYADYAWILYREGRYADAEPLAKWSLGVRESNPEVRPESLAQGLYLLAVIRRARRHPADAQPLLTRALAIDERVKGADSPVTAIVLDELAMVETDLGKFDEAEPHFKRALSIRSQFNPDVNLELASTLDHYVAYLRRIKRDEETAEFTERARAIREAFAARESQARVNVPRRGAR